MRVFGNGRRGTVSSSRQPTRNGSTTIESIPEIPGDETSTPPSRPRNHTTTSSSRPTFQWPFQSQSVSGNSTSHSAQHSRSTSFRTRRSSGWMNLRPASSILGSDIIPDYVVNFMRGETPETLAQRREMEGGHGVANVHHTRNAQSQAAEFVSLHTRVGSRGTLEGMLGNGKTGKGVRKYLTGWRGGIVLNMSLACVCLAAAIACVVLAITTERLTGKPESILEAGCGRIRALDLGLHAVANVFALCFIAGGNYVAQVLASPTRTEVAKGHAKQCWLDIGIPSIRNLKDISKGRAVLCVLVVLIAAGTHVVYNSILFVTEGEDVCALNVNGPLLAAIAILNLVFILVLALALARPSSDNPLVTLGDAIASFLMEPDHATEGACLVTKADITSGRWGCGEARYWFTQTHRWIQTPTKTRWLIWALSWLLPTGMAAAMLGMAVIDGPKDAFSSMERPTTTYELPSNIPEFGLSIILALPQLLLTALYFSTNGLMSVFYLSHEMAQFAVPGSAVSLRISSGQPMGLQTTSLYLTLPRPLSWLLFLLFVAKAFFLSQSFHLIMQDSASIGMNPLPLVILIGLLVLTLVLVLGMSSRRTDLPLTTEEGRRTGNPLALKGGSCSAVISARCHRSAAEGADVAALPLSWGVVMEGKVGHAAFSSQPVEALTVAKAYA